MFDRLFAKGFGSILLSVIAIDFAAAANIAGTKELDEIVVTAQRREESAQAVGIAMSVLSGASLAEKSIGYLNDLQNAVPSLQIEPAFGSGQPQLRMRGVGFIDYTSNNASPVGVSLDDVALALPIQTQGQLFDMDRLEVLRGPQGTLYGRNTTGGQVNFVSNRPTTDPHAGLTAEYGSFNVFASEGYISGPLMGGFLGRLSFSTAQGGGWQHDRLSNASLGNKDKVAVRVQLESDPGSAMNFRVNVHWSQDKSQETGLHLLDAYTPYNAGAGGPKLPADSSRYVTGWRLDPIFAQVTGLDHSAKPGLDSSNDGVDLTSNIDLSDARLTSITSYNRMIRREYGDWDATQYFDSEEYFRSHLNVVSEEARLASTGTSPFGWLVGVFYSDQNLEENFYSDFSDANLGFPPGVTPVVLLTTYGQHAHSFGEFGQINYHFNEAFNLTVGAREDHETRSLKDLNTGIVAGPAIPSFTGVLSPSPSATNLPSGKLALEYTPLTATMVYGSISRGVKSGGFTAHNTTSAPAVDAFAPEKLLAYEIGIKSDPSRKLRTDASVFYYRYKDQQILGKALDELSGSYIGRFVNANSRISGGELEAEWRPIGALSVSQHAGFAEGYYSSALLNSDTPSVDYNGRPESFPKWSYGGDASYRWRLGSYQITAESNYSFHDTYSQLYLLGSNAFTIPKYWLANANLAFIPSGGAWTVTLWGRNIFNRAYDTTRNFFLPGTNIAQAGEPATFGVRFNYKN